MTTLSLNLQLPDHTARELERIARLAGRTESEFLSEAVVRMIEKVQTSYEINMSAEDLDAIQEEMRPYREASSYESEDDFLNRKT